MDPARSYYQRLVARDESEAATLVQDYLTSSPGHGVHDEVFVPALNHARDDHGRGRITDADEHSGLARGHLGRKGRGGRGAGGSLRTRARGTASRPSSKCPECMPVSCAMSRS
jgi:hypothetical protein